MNTKSLQPLKGFDDRYPEDKSLDEYIFDTVKSVALLYGFKQYDGPLVEPIELYEGKTSRELLSEQAFTLTDRNKNTLMLRPEMTPSLARMVAARWQELPLPIRWFNIGLRYRYEAPQKGRNREFYQMDFDIIGSDNILADIEILSVLVELFKRFGASSKDFVIYINSRKLLGDALCGLGIDQKLTKQVIQVIDRREKVPADAFIDMLISVGLSSKQSNDVVYLLDNPQEYSKVFSDIMDLAQVYRIAGYIEVNPTIVRGLDYYTGIVFEVKARKGLARSLLGGGRYDNLVGMFGTKEQLPGVGFALSDTILKEFLADSNLLPPAYSTKPCVLVTVFSPELQKKSLTTAQKLRSASKVRSNGISVELYPGTDKLQKQLKYANKVNIRYVVIIGPDEAEQGVVKVKDMLSGDEKTVLLDGAIDLITS